MFFITYIIDFIRWCYRYPYNVFKGNKVPICTFISKHVFIKRTILGKYVYIGSYSDISYAKIGNYTCVANNVVIGGMEHPYWDLSISPKLSKEFIYGNITTIGHDVWIGTGAIIKQGITIGDGAVIGAGSFVNKDVEPYSIVVGSPAKCKKFRNCKIKEEKLLRSNYWEYTPKEAIKILKSIKEND